MRRSDLLKNILLAGFVISLLLVPSLAFAQSTNCKKENRGIFRGAYEGKYDRQPCVIDSVEQVFIVAGNILSLLIGVIAGLFAIFMVKGGLAYIVSGGAPDRVKDAKATITNAIVGLVITLIAFGIVRLLVTALGGRVT